MKSVWNKLHIISAKLYIPNLPHWLVGILALTLILRVPSFFEPYYYGDEMIYLTLGQGVRQGVTLYQEIHDNKPPLLYLAAAVAGNLFWFKVILAAWSLVTIVFFYKLARLFFEKHEKTQKVATLIFALLTTLPLLEGNTVNAELFMIGPSIFAILLLLEKGLTNKKIFFAGFLFGIGALFKIPAAFDLPIVVFYWLITSNLRKDFKIISKNTFILVLGFILPIVLTLIWYFTKGALPEYIKAAFMQNVGYLSSFRPGDVAKPFYIKNAPLLFRASVVLFGLVTLWLFRTKLSKRFMILTIWVLFALFAITLSERPYPHYFIQAVAPLSLLLSIFFAQKSFEQSLVVIPVALSLVVPTVYKFYYYPTGTYLARFVNFAVGKINKESYFSDFSPNTNRNYEIASFLAESTPKNEKVFVWDPDSPTIYALSRKNSIDDKFGIQN